MNPIVPLEIAVFKRSLRPQLFPAQRCWPYCTYLVDDIARARRSAEQDQSVTATVSATSCTKVGPRNRPEATGSLSARKRPHTTYWVVCLSTVSLGRLGHSRSPTEEEPCTARKSTGNRKMNSHLLGFCFYHPTKGEDNKQRCKLFVLDGA